MSVTFGFIGTGNMGSALVKAAVKILPPAEILITDHDQTKAEALAHELGCRAASQESVALESHFLFLGVKPHMMAGLLRDLAPSLRSRSTPPVLVSMAAGLTVAQLEELSGGICPVIRIMPNTPVSLGAGVILYARSAAVTQEQLGAFLAGMSGAGGLFPLEESLIDAGTSVSGCGPAFTYLFIDALADGGVVCGLSRADAVNFAAQTVLGAAQMVLSGGKHPEQLKNEVCSPGGSTIQGVRTLERHGLRAACMEAVIAAFEKNISLGKG